MGIKTAVGLLVLVQLASGATHFKETFGADWEKTWTPSAAKSDFGKFVLSSGKYYGDKEKDQGIQTSEDAKFYATSANFDAFSSEGKTLVVQFSVKHEQNIDCGGGYIKVMPTTDSAKLDGESPYNIMFGPDICGATKKIHFIFNYKGQNLQWKKEPRCETDTLSHTYTAIVNPDGTYEVQIDGVKKESGTLEEDWEFLKPKSTPDPDDKKPADWVDEAQMADPEDKKPDGHDDVSAEIADPEAVQPEDWDEEEDGKWEAPMIPNPEFKGEWQPKMIANPDYKGVWKPAEIPNPEYEADDNLGQYKEFGAVAIDLWQVKSGSIFDNIILTDSVEEAKAFYDETNGATKEAEKKMMDAEEETKREKEEAERKTREEEEKNAAGEDEDDEDEDEEEDDDKKDEL